MENSAAASSTLCANNTPLPLPESNRVLSCFTVKQFLFLNMELTLLCNEACISDLKKYFYDLIFRFFIIIGITKSKLC